MYIKEIDPGTSVGGRRGLNGAIIPSNLSPPCKLRSCKAGCSPVRLESIKLIGFSGIFTIIFQTIQWHFLSWSIIDFWNIGLFWVIWASEFIEICVGFLLDSSLGPLVRAAWEVALRSVGGLGRSWSWEELEQVHRHCW